MKGNVEPTLATPTSMEEALASANRKATAGGAPLKASVNQKEKYEGTSYEPR
jgi:hypothetical protein